ncbi:MAG: hypothetical protein OXG81_01265 [Acidobacteria bacterium]|nr:hypothetical protein [Acidobacteriota bacterium]
MGGRGLAGEEQWGRGEEGAAEVKWETRVGTEAVQAANANRRAAQSAGGNPGDAARVTREPVRASVIGCTDGTPAPPVSPLYTDLSALAASRLAAEPRKMTD